jgi:uncharacterized protein
MKILSIAGTAAMFLVGGGILVHGIPGLHGWIDVLLKNAAGGPGMAGMFRLTMSLLLDAAMGVVAGALALAVARGVQRVVRSRA